MLNRFQSIGKSKCSLSKVGLDIDGKIEFDKNKVANQFNSFFSLIDNSLVDTLPLSNGCYGIDFVKRFYSKQGVLPNSFSFTQVSVNQITKMLEELQVSKSTGLDDIPARFLRDAADIIAPTVTFIVNLSLEFGIFPS